MKLLAIDTSLQACSLAVYNSQAKQTTYTYHELANRQQTQIILQKIKDLLNESGMSLNELDALIYGAGPGSFTGIRIASSVTQALSFAVHLPVIGISSLQALAQSAFQKTSQRNILVALNAHAGCIYFATYHINNENLAVLNGQEIVCKPSELALDHLENSSGYGIGDGWLTFIDELKLKMGNNYPAHIDAHLNPEATALLQLAMPQVAAAKTNYKHALPCYLR